MARADAGPGGARQRWADRRHEEMAVLQDERQRCEEAHRRYATQWEDYFTRSTALDQEKRTLAERSLAMEQYRLEILGRSPDSARAEKRLERLRRRLAGQNAAVQRQLNCERQALAREAQRLDALAEQLQEQAAVLAQRQAEFAQDLAEEEQAQAQIETLQACHELDMQRLHGQRVQHERQLQTLRDEVERLAQLLIDDGFLSPP